MPDQKLNSARSPFERAFEALMLRAEGAGAGALKAARQAGAIAIERDPARALIAYARAEALDPVDAQVQLALARLKLETGDAAAGLAHAEEAFAVAEDAATQAQAAFAMGEIHGAQGAEEAAREAFEAALSLNAQRAAKDPEAIEPQRAAARCRQRLAELEKDPAVRTRVHREALETLAALPPAGPGLIEDLAFGHARLAALAQARDDAAEAAAHIAAARDQFERLHALEPDEPAWRGEIAHACIQASRLALSAGDAPAARAAAERAVRLLLGLAAKNPAAPERRIALACAWTCLAEAAGAQKDASLARSSADQACAILTQLIEEKPGPETSVEYGRAQTARAAALLGLNEMEEARTVAAHACAALDPLAAKGLPAALSPLAAAWALLAEIAMKAQKPKDARDALARAVVIDARGGAKNATLFQARLAQACAAAGDPAAARKAHAACADAWLARVQAEPGRREHVWGLARALSRLGAAAQEMGDARACAAAWRDGLEMIDLLCEHETEDAALRMRAALCANLYDLNPHPGSAHRAKALGALDALAQRCALTAQDVELQAQLLGVL